MRNNDQRRGSADGRTRAADVAPRTAAPDDSTSVDLVASMDAVEFYADEGLYRASYDGGRDPASLAVVAVIATAYCRDRDDLDPLQSAVDVDAIDRLFRSPGDSGSVSFHYEGFDVTIDDGTIEARQNVHGDA